MNSKLPEKMTVSILAAILIVAVFLNFGNVIGRYIFGRTFSGVDELQLGALVLITFVGAFVAALRGVHLRINVLENALPVKARRVVKWIEYCVAVPILGILAWYSYDYTSRMYALGRKSDMLGAPMWIQHSFLTVGLGLLFLATLVAIARTARDRDKPDEDASDSEFDIT